MSVKLNLQGVENLLDEIRKAEGDVDSAARRCIEKSADIMQNELKSAMRHPRNGDPVDESLINRMPHYTIENNGSKTTARVGFKPESYNPENPSDYYKALFANYGTPFRKEHGRETARHFVIAAKNSAAKKIKKQQEETLNEILKGLK